MLRELITDDYFAEGQFEVLTERASLPTGVIMKVKGPVGIIDTENKNGRWYSGQFWDDILGRDEVQEAIQNRALVGAADHPKTLTPPIAAVSHVITNTWVEPESKALMSEADVLDTPMGRIVKTLFDAKVKIGASTRGAGKTVKKSGRNEVASEGYKWGGWDFCFDPSAQNAFPSAVKEQVEQIISDSSIEQLGRDTDSIDFYQHLLEKMGCNVSLLLEKYEESSTVEGFFITVTKGKKDVVSILDSLKIENYKVIAETTSEAVVQFESVEDRKKFVEKAPSIMKEAASAPVNTEVEELKQKIQALTEQVLKLTSEVTNPESSALSSQVASLKQEVFNLRKKLSEKEGVNKKLEHEVSTLSSHLSLLEKKAESVVKNVKEKAEGGEEETSRLQEENSLLYKKLESAQKSLEIVEAQMESLSDEFDSLSIVNKKLIKEKSIYSSQVKALELDTESLQNECTELKLKYFSVKSGCTEEEILREQITDLSLEQFEASLEEEDVVEPSRAPSRKPLQPIFESAPKVTAISLKETSSAGKPQGGRQSSITAILEKMNK